MCWRISGTFHPRKQTKKSDGHQNFLVICLLFDWPSCVACSRVDWLLLKSRKLWGEWREKARVQLDRRRIFLKISCEENCNIFNVCIIHGMRKSKTRVKIAIIVEWRSLMIFSTYFNISWMRNECDLNRTVTSKAGRQAGIDKSLKEWNCSEVPFARFFDWNSSFYSVQQHLVSACVPWISSQ